MPSSNPFSRLFARSPFGRLQEHIAKAYAASEQLQPFMAAVLANNWEEAARVREIICQLEHEADDLKKEIRRNLPNSLFMPVSRSDLLELVSLQDKLANRAKDISGLMLGRQMQIPEPLTEPLLRFVRTGISAVEQAQQTINEIEELLESGFGRQVTELLTGMIDKLDQLEHEADEQEIQIRAQLFRLEKNLPPVDVMFLYRIIDWIGELSDRAQRVGGRLQILMAR